MCSIFQRWVDEYLHWNASQFNGVDRVWIPSKHLWIPDIFISNLYVIFWTVRTLSCAPDIKHIHIHVHRQHQSPEASWPIVDHAQSVIVLIRITREREEGEGKGRKGAGAIIPYYARWRNVPRCQSQDCQCGPENTKLCKNTKRSCIPGIFNLPANL